MKKSKALFLLFLFLPVYGQFPIAEDCPNPVTNAYRVGTPSRGPEPRARSKRIHHTH